MPATGGARRIVTRSPPVGISLCVLFMLSFCQQRHIPTEGIRLVQQMNVDPRTHLISEVGIRIELPEGFPEQYRAAVVRAADQCTVKKHLQFPPAIQVYTTTRETAAAGV
ncbi:MAG: hypothetical protein M1401_20345 [Chloroflexi bacterium]|nr:hypothetical protein [Chloroflexota bacterium]